jgi:hypothetical protein
MTLWRARLWQGDNQVHFIDFECAKSSDVEEAFDAALPDPPDHDALTVAPAPRNEQ